MPDKVLKTSFVGVNGTQQESYSRMGFVSMGDPSKYSEMNGVLTFRGGPQRQNASATAAKVEMGELQLLKTIRTMRLDTFTGFGFGSQPIIVKWYKNIREMMNISDNYRTTSGLKEVIVPSADGKIYFFDLDTMSATRPAITVEVPMSVTASVNPYGYPLLYVGQSAETVGNYKVNAGLRVYSLLDQKMLRFMTSLNTIAEGKTHGVNSSPIVETTSDTLIYSDANGMIYTVGMNTQFDLKNGIITVNPSDVEYGYTTKLQKATQGIPASVSVYGNYIYFGDLAGSLQCLDMNTMQCVWARDMGDSVLASIAIEETSEGVFLYTGTVVNKTQKSRVQSLFKINALTGETVWEYQTTAKAKYSSKTANQGIYAGLMASPIIGQGDIDDLVIFNVNRLEVDKSHNSAVLLGLDKATGMEVWSEYLDADSVSSPVAVYNEDGTSYIVVGDEMGTLRLMDGYNGSTLYTVDLESPIQASPAVYGNRIVVGTTGGMLYFIDIK